MELRHLRYFLAAADAAHFRRAAESLLVSQPTLSLQVRELEKELGVDLFERVGRRVRLTQAGGIFREYAQRALTVLEEGRTALNELEGLLRGSLTVGVVQTVNAYLTPHAVARFANDHPNVRLRIEELSAGEIESGVSDGTLDLGVSFVPTIHGEVESEPLFDEEFVLVVPPGHRLAERQRVTVTALAGEPLCLLGQAYCTRRIIEDCFARAGVRPSVVVEMNSVEGVLAVVRAGGPATILPELGAIDGPQKVVRLERPTPKRTVGLLRVKGHAPLRARTEFASVLRQTVEGNSRRS